MADQKINIYIRGFDEASGPAGRVAGAIQNLGREAGNAVSGVDNHTSSLRRMAETAGGIVGAALLQKIGGAIIGSAKEAFEATVAYERLEMAMESMSKRDLMRATTLTETVTVGYKEITMMGATAEEITKLTLKRDTMAAKMQEESERHRQLIARWGEEGLAVKTHAATMAESQFKLDELNASLAKMGATTSKTIPITETHTRSLMSAAEAEAMAAETAQELLTWIEQLAIKSPFTQEGVQQAFKTAMAYGFVTDQAADLMLKTGQLDEVQRGALVTAQRMTSAMLDFAAGTGADAYSMERISRALGQIQAKGKLSGEEVRQLTEAGLSADRILADAFGKSTAEIVAMREKGLIPADKAILAIVESLEQDYAGAGEKMTQTFAGLVSTFSDVKIIAKRELFAGVFEAMQPYLARFVGWLEGAVPLMRSWGEVLGGKLTEALAKIDKVFSGLSLVTRVFREFMAGEISFGAFDGLYQALTGSSDGVMRFVVQMQGVEQTMRGVFDGVKRVVDLITVIPQILVEFAQGGISFGAFDKLYTALTGSSDGIMRFVVQAQALEATLRGALGGVIETISGVFERLTGNTDLLKGGFLGVAGVAGVLVGGAGLGGLLKIVLPLTGPVGTIAGLFGGPLLRGVTGLLSPIATLAGALGGAVGSGLLGILGGLQGMLFKLLTPLFSVVRIFGMLLAPLSAVLAPFSGLIGLLSGLLGPLLPIIAALVAVGAVLSVDWPAAATLATQAFAGVKELIASVGRNIGPVIEAFKQFGGGALQEIIAFITGAETKFTNLNAILTSLKTFVTTVFGDVVTALRGAGFPVDELLAKFTAFKTQAMTLWGQLVAFFAPTIERLKSGFAAMKESLAPLGPQLQALWQAASSVLGPLATLVGGIVVAAFNLLMEIVAAVMPRVGQIIGGVVQAATAIFNTLRRVIQGVIDFVVAVVNGDWAGAWQAAKDIVGGLVDGIIGVVTGLWTAVEGLVMGLVEGVVNWFTNLYDTLVGHSIIPDMIEDIINAFAGLIEDLIEKAQEIYDTVVEKLQEMLDWVSDMAKELWDRGVAAIQGLIDGMVSLGSALLSAVQTLITDNVTRAVDWVTALVTAGRDIIKGLLQGLAEKRDDVIEWIKGLVGDMVNAVKRFLGIESPSKVFTDIGVNILKGLIAGIEEMTPETVLALSNAMRAAMDGVIAAVNALQALANLEFISGLEGKVAQLASMIRSLVAGLKTMAEYFANPGTGLDSAKAVMEGLRPVLDGVRNAVDAFTAMGGISKIELLSAGLARFMVFLRTTVPDLVRALADASGDLGSDGMLLAAGLAEVIGTIGVSLYQAVTAINAVAGLRIEEAARRLIFMTEGLVRWINWLIDYLPDGMLEDVAAKAEKIMRAVAPWGAMASAVGAIASVAGLRIEEAAQRLIFMTEGLVRWVNWLINYLPNGMLEDVAAKAETIIRVLSPWGAIADAVKAINDAAGAGVISHGGNAAKMVWLAYALVDWVNWLINYLPNGMLDNVAAKAETIVRALAPWRAIADAIKAINDAAGAGVISHAGNAAKMVWLAYALVDWVNWLINYLPNGMLDNVAAKAETIVRALAPWRAIADAIKAINDAAGAGVISHGGNAAKMVWLAYALVDWVNWLINYLPNGMLDNVAAKAETIIRALSPWRAMADAVKAVADSADITTDAVDRLVEDIAYLGQALSTALMAGSLTISDDAIALAERLQQIVGVVRPGLEAIKALADYTNAVGIADAVTGFVADLLIVASGLQTGLGSPSAALLLLYDQAAAFGQRIQAIVAVVQPGLATIKALAEYTRAEGIAEATADFMADMLLVAAGLQTALGSPSEALLLLYDQAAAFAQRIAAIVGFVQPGIAAVKSLADYARIVNIAQATANFMADMLLVAAGLQTALGSPSEALLLLYDQAAAFGQRIAAIVGFVQPGLAAIKELAGYTRAENIAQAVGLFVVDILDVAIGLRQALGAPSQDMLDLYDAAAAFGQRIAAIVGVVQPGIAAIKELAGYTRALRIGLAVQAFVADLLVVADELRRALSLSIPPEVFDVAVVFSGRIQALIGVIQPGVQALAALATYSRVGNIVTATQGFVADLMAAANVLRVEFANPDPDLLAALDGARQFGELVGGVLTFIAPAIDAMVKLREYARPYGVGTGMVTLVRDIELLVTWINTTLGNVGNDALQSAALFAQLMEQIVTSILIALSGLALISRIENVYDSGLAIGGSWIDGLIDGLTGRLTDLVALMTYIRGLFPSSPAKHGPWRELPQGKTVGEAWGMDLTTGVLASLRPITSAMNAVHGAMGLAPGSGRAGTTGAVVHAPVTVNMGGTWNVRNDGDIRRIAEEVGAVFAQQSNVQRRMNYAWSGL